MWPPTSRRAAWRSSLAIDRVTASRLGIAPATIDNTLYDAFGQRQINTMYTQLNQYHVILEAQPQFQHDPNKLSKIYIQANASSGATGAGRMHVVRLLGVGFCRLECDHHRRALHAVLRHSQPADECIDARTTPVHRHRVRRTPRLRTTLSNAVPLSAFTPLRTTTEPLSINHQGQFPAVTVSFNLAPNAALGTAITAIEKVQKNLHMPASMQAAFQGTAAAFRKFALE